MNNGLTERLLTRYEEAVVIGSRAMELRSGDPPRIKLDLNIYNSVNDVARLEFEQGKLDYKIVRKLPTGEEDIIPLQAMRHCK
jgi:DNA-directed RNA polymerase subunit K/omega